MSLKVGGTEPCELRDRQVPSRGQLQSPAQTACIFGEQIRDPLYRQKLEPGGGAENEAGVV